MPAYNPHFVKLNSTDFADAPITFYGIITLEIILSVALLVCQPYACCAFLKTEVFHRNFRIQTCSLFFYYTLQLHCRFILMYYELNDIPNSKNDSLLFWVETIRDAIISYFCSVPGSFAFERYIATRYWLWYERGSASTLWVIIFVEIVNVIPAFTSAYLMYSEKLSNTACLVFFGLILILGVIGPQSIITLSPGPFKFNVEVMKYMFKTAIPTAIASGIPIGGLAFKLYGPTEWRLFRNVAYAFFDLGIVLIGVICTIYSVIGNDRIYNEFKKLYPFSVLFAVANFRSTRISQQATSSLSNPSEAEMYFSQLRDSWS